MSVLKLPAVVYDDGLSDLLTRLGWVERLDAETINLDFQNVSFYMPGALVTLLVTVHRWCDAGRKVMFVNAEAAPAFRYLQRMDFFQLSGIALPENFVRHEEAQRFVTLRRVGPGQAGGVDRLCQEIAGCIFPREATLDDPEKTGPFDVLEFVASELINNIIQHARGPGYVAVQHYPQRGLICLGIADGGIGIRQSFEETNPEFWDPEMSHLDAVRTALQPRASSKVHLASGWGGRINEGIGLSMLREIAIGAAGVFTLASGTGFYQMDRLVPRPLPVETELLENCQGTLCSVVLCKQKLGNHQQILLDAKNRLGLLHKDQSMDKFFQ